MLIVNILKELGFSDQQVKASLVAGSMMNLLPLYPKDLSAEWKKADYDYSPETLALMMWSTCSEELNAECEILLEKGKCNVRIDSPLFGYLYEITHGFLDGLMRFLVENGFEKEAAKSFLYPMTEHVLYCLAWGSGEEMIKTPLFKDICPDAIDNIIKFYDNVQRFNITSAAYSLAKYDLSNGKDQEYTANSIYSCAVKTYSVINS